MIGHLAVATFWLPTFVWRHGALRGLGQAADAIRGRMSIERWKRGLLPQIIRTVGDYRLKLPTGRRATVILQLLGGELNLAFLRVEVSTGTDSLFYIERPGHTCPGPVELDGTTAHHWSDAQHSLLERMDAAEAEAVMRMVDRIVMLLE